MSVSMFWFFDALGSAFFARAVVGGAVVAIVCGVVGTWVVIRGMAFFGEAIGHGMLPGVAIATLAGIPPVIGGGLSAAVMSALVAALQRRGKLSYDTSIGLLFVAMLATGVIIVSGSGSFATDLTAVLFGDILAISWTDIALLAATSSVVLTVAAARHRAFVALAFDRRLALTLGYRPHLTQGLLVGLVMLAVVASAQAVGTLLVVALLLGPAVAAQPWHQSIQGRMVIAAVIGVLAVTVGLAISWAIGSAAGSTVAASGVAAAGISHSCKLAAARIWNSSAPIASLGSTT
ncbi:zinc ABC transporter permease AztB [Leucobacter sp. NPDC015123]|uniref:zinc ABC transporter permease AztB n=1 Tax=Leucobacter sp. NPDC015123 TaxID=3364129 RepID=UPI0036F49CF4